MIHRLEPKVYGYRSWIEYWTNLLPFKKADRNPPPGTSSACRRDAQRKKLRSKLSRTTKATNLARAGALRIGGSGCNLVYTVITKVTNLISVLLPGTLQNRGSGKETGPTSKNEAIDPGQAPPVDTSEREGDDTEQGTKTSTKRPPYVLVAYHLALLVLFAFS